METSRVYNIAQFLIQISIAILPLGAGVSGVIFQQDHSLSIWISISLIWIGLIAFAISIYVNLTVLRTSPENADEILMHEKKLTTAVNIFIAGVAVLLISPLGMLFQNTQRVIVASSNEIILFQSTTSSVKSRIMFTVSPVKDKITITSEAGLPVCIHARELWSRTLQDNTTFVSTWEISSDPGCAFGDYILNFNVEENKIQIKQESIIVKIEEKSP
jgi:hypothetical protein